jgi:hypothetical protein
MKKPTQYPHFSSLKLQEKVFNLASNKNLVASTTPSNIVCANMQKTILEIIESFGMLMHMNDSEFLILQQLSYLINRKYN